MHLQLLFPSLPFFSRGEKDLLTTVYTGSGAASGLTT